MLLLPGNVEKTIDALTASATNRTWRHILWRPQSYLA